mgnify:CR=1 FL=1
MSKEYKTLKFKRILKKWADEVFKITLKRVGFFSTEIYDFSASGSQAELVRSATGAENKLLIVVGRNHYFEATRDYPIGHMGDLKKLLKNEQWRFPFKGILLRRIERLDQQSHRVTSWVIKNEVLDNLDSRPLWVVPESACVEQLATDTVVEVDRLSEKVCVSVTPNGLFSSLSRKDSSGHGLDLAAGHQLLGVKNVSKLADSEAVETILLGITHALKRSLTCFYIGFNTQSDYSYRATRSLKLSLAIGVSYLLLTSGYLWVADTWIDYKLGLSSVQAEESLAARKLVDDYTRQVIAFNEVVGDVAPTWIAWDVFLDLHDLGVSFRAINSSSGAVTFYMTAPKATDVLSRLHEDSRVASAEFSVPVRERRGLEEFAVEVIFRKPILLDGEADNE